MKRGCQGVLVLDVNVQGRLGAITVDMEGERRGRGPLFLEFILHFTEGLAVEGEGRAGSLSVGVESNRWDMETWVFRWS